MTGTAAAPRPGRAGGADDHEGAAAPGRSGRPRRSGGPGGVVAGRADQPDGSVGTRRGRALRVALLTAVMVAAVQLAGGGYEYGFGEQVLLSVKGISWADPTAYVGDWFNDRAPQPHVLYDVVTAVSERWGVRPQVYFAYWLASLAVCAWAIVTLADHWLPRRLRPLELVVGALMVVGPYFALGTFLVVHREAVPNGLGGALGLLTAALLVVGRDRAAVVAALVTTAVHVQHGSVVAALLLVAWLLDRERLRRPVVRWFPVVVAVILLVVVVVARLRGIVAGTGDFSEVCETASPGHCDPDSWSWAAVRDGVGVVLLGALAPRLAWTGGSVRAAAVVGFPALVALTALVTDLADVEPFQSLGRQLFLYRFVMVVAPFAAWAVVLALSRPLVRGPGRASVTVALGGAAGLSWWLATEFGMLQRFGADAHAQARVVGLLVGLGVVAAVVGWAVLRARLTPRSGTPADRAVSRLVAVATVAALLGLGQAVVGSVPLRLDYRPDEGAVALGRELERATPPGSIILARPDVGWTRLLSRRGVVIDCKGVPYGGEPWDEYNERLAAVGVPSPLRCGNEGFAGLTPEEIRAIGERFGATHVLLDAGDAARGQLEGRWPKVYDGGPPTSTALFRIPVEPAG